MNRERLVEAMAEAMAEMSGILVWANINGWAQGIWLKRARAALAVAEPVVRADERAECAMRLEGVPWPHGSSLPDYLAVLRTGGTP